MRAYIVTATLIFVYNRFRELVLLWFIIITLLCRLSIRKALWYSVWKTDDSALRCLVLPCVSSVLFFLSDLAHPVKGQSANVASDQGL